MNYGMIEQRIRNLSLSAMFLALGLILPFLTGQMQHIGNMLLPMHLPVLLCGLLCGWQYGMTVGAVLPLLRFALFGMPPIFPIGVSMAFELAAYGLIAGVLYAGAKKQGFAALYRALIAAMVGGRVVWGVVRVLLTGVAGEAFTWKMFLSGAFLTAIPGIILQLVLIPVILAALDHTGMVRFEEKTK